MRPTTLFLALAIGASGQPVAAVGDVEAGGCPADRSGTAGPGPMSGTIAGGGGADQISALRQPEGAAPPAPDAALDLHRLRMP
jgi:hypothetical protein